MANNHISVEEVKKTIRALEVSPSCSDSSSPVYGMRKTAGQAHNSKSDSGGHKSTGFKGSY